MFEGGSSQILPHGSKKDPVVDTIQIKEICVDLRVPNA
jgi:hypothetical protein